MIDALWRKARQVLGDPVLRRWLIARLAGRNPGVAPFTAHHPPYLAGLEAGGKAASASFAELPPAAPATAIELPLAGTTVRVEPGAEADLFRNRYDDLEDLLAAHRFAWLPVLGEACDPAWVQALWAAWRGDHATPGGGWPWHPYTAAERALNVLAYGRRRGLPGPIDDTLRVLAAHPPAIHRKLEYFGDHHTSNHLSNNGRGLFILGLELGDGRWADIGARILVEEARRIFAPSGILNEGSSHYHLLLTRNYVEAWHAARTHGRPEEAALRDIATRALAAAAPLVLPGGLALIGDISPDCRPDYLTALLDIPVGGAISADGWLRADFGPWAGLWHAAPGGWSAMPGHGHQDCGGFEVHFDGEALFVDPGRGSYTEFAPGSLHNGLLVDNHDPYPPNRPYYDDAFRRRVCGPPPVLAGDDDGVRLVHHGFSRLAGVGSVSRRWKFGDQGFSITDRVEGRGRHTVRRLLHTPLAVDGAHIGGKFELRAEGRSSTAPTTLWRAYGRGAPGTAIHIDSEVSLPWESEIIIEVP